MKMNTLILLATTLFFNSTLRAEQSVFLPVQELFAAMSNVDYKKMKSLVTEDFQLLEVGEDWTIDDLINVVKPSDYKRRNFFNVIRSEVNGNMAWVSYWNKATFSNGEREEVVAWLESAVMVKQGDVWLIEMLHSTRVKPENLPENISLTEYQ